MQLLMASFSSSSTRSGCSASSCTPCPHQAQPAASAPSIPTRRQLATAAAGAALALLLPPELVCTAAPTPYERGQHPTYGLAGDPPRLRHCETDANPNCLSTTARSDAYLPAWEAPEGPLATVADDFGAALAAVEPGARLVDARSSEGLEYRRWQVPDRLFDHDDIEARAP